MQRQYDDLVAAFGIKRARHGFQEGLEKAKEAARTGYNRAAEVRDRLKKEMDAGRAS